MYDWIRFCEDFNIPYDSKSASARRRLLIPCPFCRNEAHKNKGFYGSIHLENDRFFCWRCNGRPIHEVVFLLTGQRWDSIKRKYTGLLTPADFKPIIHPETLELPGERLNERAKQYLRSRDFDPDELEEKYKLRSTDHTGNYRFRIIIPIYYQYKLVSFTTRDYTGKQDIRYMSCPKEKEVMCHKHTLYGLDSVKEEDHIIVVEGVFDAIRMRKKTVCTFGINFTNEQVLLLSEFKKVTILFDYEDQARAQANKLGSLLAGLGVEVDLIFLKEGDPGGLSQNEANSLLKNIFGS